MFRKWFWVRMLLGLVAAAVMVTAAVGLLRLGWQRGYAAASPTSEEGADRLHPYGRVSPRWSRVPGRHFGFVSPWLGVGFLFRIGSLILTLFLVGSLFRLFGRRAYCAHGGMDWLRHRHPHSSGHCRRPFVGKVKPQTGHEEQAADDAAQK